MNVPCTVWGTGEIQQPKEYCTCPPRTHKRHRQSTVIQIMSRHNWNKQKILQEHMRTSNPILDDVGVLANVS